jgi:hypothetical protein
MNAGSDSSDKCRLVHELLLGYLQAAGAPPWPGADGLTLEEVLASYPQWSASGLVPDLPSLLQRHPELCEDLSKFFAPMQN